MTRDEYRRTEEADYAVANLRRARQEAMAHPGWFEPKALERIDKAIACIQEARLGAKAA
jgi:hypothetical protein